MPGSGYQATVIIYVKKQDINYHIDLLFGFRVLVLCVVRIHGKESFFPGGSLPT